VFSLFDQEEKGNRRQNRYGRDDEKNRSMGHIVLREANKDDFIAYYHT
jgi:hypothetical protein